MSSSFESPDFNFKIVTIGQSSVGKTSIILRYTENTFNKNTLLTTLGVDYKTKEIKIENRKVSLSIWDTAGQEKFNHLTKQYYKGADGVLLVFDLTNKDSYNKLQFWYDEVKNHLQLSEIGLILIGNKSDDIEHREISQNQGNEFASKLLASYLEVSAATKDNINQSFKLLILEIFRKRGLFDLKNRDNVRTDIWGNKHAVNKVKLRLDEMECAQTSKCEC